MTVWWILILQGFSKSRWTSYIEGSSSSTSNADDKYKYNTYSHNG